jgi:hypothetical protein
MKSIDELKERLSIWHVKYCKLIESKISAPYGGYRTYPDAELFLGKPQQRLRGQYIRYKHLSCISNAIISGIYMAWRILLFSDARDLRF